MTLYDLLWPIWAIPKGASKMGYFFKDINDISRCKRWSILILFNSKQTKEAGRAFKSKYDHLI